MKAQGGGVEVRFYSFFNLCTRWGGWLMPCSVHFVPLKETRYPFHTGGLVSSRAGLDGCGKLSLPPESNLGPSNL